MVFHIEGLSSKRVKKVLRTTHIGRLISIYAKVSLVFTGVLAQLFSGASEVILVDAVQTKTPDK